MTAWTIACNLMRSRWLRTFVLPGYTPALWWECDLFELTAAGYFREYEIKLSRGDFLADAVKQRSARWRWEHGQQVRSAGVRKHDALALHDRRGPTRFWYVTPAGLIKPEEIPEWAGLLEVTQLYGKLVRFKTTKEAPRLHQEKCDPKVIEHARSVCYYRYHRLAQRLAAAEMAALLSEPQSMEEDPCNEPCSTVAATT